MWFPYLSPCLCSSCTLPAPPSSSSHTVPVPPPTGSLPDPPDTSKQPQSAVRSRPSDPLINRCSVPASLQARGARGCFWLGHHGAPVCGTEASPGKALCHACWPCLLFAGHMAGAQYGDIPWVEPSVDPSQVPKLDQTTSAWRDVGWEPGLTRVIRGSGKCLSRGPLVASRWA